MSTQRNTLCSHQVQPVLVVGWTVFSRGEFLFLLSTSSSSLQSALVSTCLLSVYNATVYLQLFIGQYLIWMTSDTRSLLTLVHGHNYLNVIVTFLFFVFASQEIRGLTHIFCSLVPKLSKSLINECATLFGS